MSFIRADLKSAAKNQLTGNWGSAIGAMVLVCVVIGLAASIFTVIADYGVKVGSAVAVSLSSLGSLAVAVLALPLTFGVYQFYLALVRRQTVSATTPFYGYRRFAPSVILLVLMQVFIFLWSLLLLIPGIIKSFSYAMCPYILADDEDIAPLDAITKSREMMNGHKAEFFVLQLSFIPWLLLVGITFGIAALYVTPYMQATNANFYLALKAEAASPDERQAEQAAEEVMSGASSWDNNEN